MDKKVHFYAGFRHRLELLRDDICRLLYEDSTLQGIQKVANFIPHLFQVWSYMWMKNWKDLTYNG